MDAAVVRDAGPDWARRGCTPAISAPVNGLTPWCPQVHDYVRVRLGPDGGPRLDAGNMGWYCPDGALEDGEEPGWETGCGRYEPALLLLESCPGWLTCPDVSELGPCYMCPAWGDSPWAL